MYYVDASEELKKQVHRLHRQSLKEARGRKFVEALRAIYERLHADPLEFGEPLYQLPMMRLFVRTAAITPLVVTYSVSIDHHLVTIKSLQLLVQA